MGELVLALPILSALFHTYLVPTLLYVCLSLGWAPHLSSISACLYETMWPTDIFDERKRTKRLRLLRLGN